jgi:hypothetical protein
MKERTRRGLDVLQAAVLLGLAGDALLRATPWGVNALLWMLIAVAAGLMLLARWRRSALVNDSPLLILPLLFFTACVVWRDSATLKLIDAFAVFLALSVAILRTRAASVRLASMKEHASAICLSVFDAGFGLPTVVLGDVEWREIPHTRWSKYLWGVIRGVLIALPLVLLFGGLLMAADAVFAGFINRAFDIDAEVVSSHLILTILFSWVAGGFLRGLLEERDAVLANSVNATLFALVEEGGKNEAHEQNAATREDGAAKTDAPVMRKRISLGIVEVGVVLGLLDLLFLAFVTIQIRYFFGGSALVQATTGLTFAEYARRGFFELVWVVALVLPLLLVSHWLLRKENPVHERIFRVLAGAQVALLFVIMASAFERVRLYQREYGLTEQRLYTMAFMVWLALVFVWFAWTVLRGARERFASGALLALFVVAGLVHVINPDDLIVRVNVSHAAKWGRGFDAIYATGLSADAVPALAASLPALSRNERCVVAASLLNRAATDDYTDWRTWNLSRSRAQETVRQNVTALREIRCEEEKREAPAPSAPGEDVKSVANPNAPQPVGGLNGTQ